MQGPHSIAVGHDCGAGGWDEDAVDGVEALQPQWEDVGAHGMRGVSIDRLMRRICAASGVVLGRPASRKPSD